ncbi:MAG: anthranilate synthase component I [Burkholderiales bacterium]
MTEQEFLAYARRGYNRIPLTLERYADLDTPLSVYLKLANRPYCYLLESVHGGERFGRYSFIGLPARTRVEVRGHRVRVQRDGETLEEIDSADPLAFIENFLGRFKALARDDLPRFCGGLVGYFGYEAVRYMEPRLAHGDKPDALGGPDILLLLSEELVVLDNRTGRLHLVVYADPVTGGAYQNARQRLRELSRQLGRQFTLPSQQRSALSPAYSEFGAEAFCEAVKTAKHYIFDGDIMQVVLSQRMSMAFQASALSLYRALRSLNPSPYMFHFDLDDFHLVGASPEILVRLEHGTVTLRPIAGTRPRGANPAEDEALARELLADPKERAEHVMLMDLGRNDVGRVAQTGSVHVTENMMIENYSHVMHIVSNVEGRIKPGLTALDVLRATFPAGTVSGAPKVRAMEIIDELEPTKRGVYAGAVGYLGFNGDMDLAIAIRTAVVRGQKLYVQAGAGIVADSVPENEWQETQNKARAVLRAAEIAQQGLDADGE